jgi:hypothetical protein
VSSSGRSRAETNERGRLQNSPGKIIIGADDIFEGQKAEMKAIKVISLIMAIALTALGCYFLVWGIIGRAGLEGWQIGVKNWSVILGLLVIIVGLFLLRFQSRNR